MPLTQTNVVRKFRCQSGGLTLDSEVLAVSGGMTKAVLSTRTKCTNHFSNIDVTLLSLIFVLA